MAINVEAYEEKKQRLMDFLRSHHDGNIRLNKKTSNLFRDRKEIETKKLDVKNFNNVISVDIENGLVEVEGMTPYVKLVSECLKYGVVPTVVPQLKSITIGGAVTGVGIESSSFKYGLVHETVKEMEILLSDGRIVVCTPDNEYKDLFFGFPNSYGTLGYVLKLKVQVVPVKKYVSLTHVHHSDIGSYFQDLKRWSEKDIDFMDGVIFGRGEYYLTIGRFVDEAPYTSDYTYKNIYYKTIRDKQTDYLTVEDYIWRWDTDWFWCSKNVYAQKPLVRRILGKSRLNSITYTKMMRWNSKWKVTHYINRLLGIHSESVIQDVDIPLDRCPEFLEFYFDNIRFMPVWICPIHAYDKTVKYDLYPMNADSLYVNFGFWDVISGRKIIPQGHYNKLVEQKVMESGGIKSLYSDSYYTKEQFWQIYNKPVYDKLKKKYDAKGALKDLFAKCVLQE